MSSQRIQSIDAQYLNVMHNLWNYGERFIAKDGQSRNESTRSMFGVVEYHMDLRTGFPLLTSKFVWFKGVKTELLWMLRGESNIKYMLDRNVHIWDQWAIPTEYRTYTTEERLQIATDAQLQQFSVKKVEMLEGDVDALLTSAGVPAAVMTDGELGRVYGMQWRHFQTPYRENMKIRPEYQKTVDVDGQKVLETDQIKYLEYMLRNDPFSRRIVLSAWNCAEIDQMALPPCHDRFIIKISTQKDENGRHYMDTDLVMRSNDHVTGTPFNLAQYALLTQMLCHVHGFTPRYYHYHVAGDAHIYDIQEDAVKEHLSRTNSAVLPYPKVHINGDFDSILDIQDVDIVLEGYTHHGKIDLTGKVVM